MNEIMTDRAMRILLLYWGKKGGGAIYSYETARQLSLRKDVELHLSISTLNEMKQDFEELGTPIQYVNTYHSYAQFLNMMLRRRKRVTELIRSYIEDHEIDLLITGMDFFWGESLHKACELAGVKSLYVIHEPKPHPGEPFLMSLIKRITLKRAILSADHLLTLNNSVKEFITDYYRLLPEKVSMIPLGIFNYFKATSPRKLSDRKEITLLYFGRVE